MKNKIKLGIIGTGLAAKNLHLPALKKLTDEFEITAICNHTEAKAKDYLKLVGNVPYYSDYKDLFKDKNIDAVDITLPINLNYKVTSDAIKAGRHVILEKPIAGNIKEANKLIEISKKSSLILMVAENFRYRKVYRRVKEILNSGGLGKAYAAQWNVFFQVTTDNEYGATKWRQNHSYPGGFMLDAGVHNTAALRLLFGEVKSVSAFTSSVNPSIGTPDTMSIQLRFDSGTNVIFNLFFSVTNSWENKLLVFCENGTIEVNENLIIIKNANSPDEDEDCSDDSGFYEEFMNFYSAIINGEKILSDFNEGYKDFEVISAALDSAKKNKTRLLKYPDKLL